MRSEAGRIARHPFIVQESRQVRQVRTGAKRTTRFRYRYRLRDARESLTCCHISDVIPISERYVFPREI